MQGVKALKSALHSSVRISSADLDARGELPVRECGLALFLEVLYHLKNPFSVLERLAESARYCLLSTAIAAPSKDQHDGFADLPAAFLAGKDGLRGDETNYWFFTEAALRRSLVDRTGWEVCMERRGQSRIYDTGCTTRPEVDLPVAQPQASGRRAFAIIRGLAQAGERRVAVDRAALFGLARRARQNRARIHRSSCDAMVDRAFGRRRPQDVRCPGRVPLRDRGRTGCGGV
jgi:hypothetical protein